MQQSDELSSEERKALLAVARRAIECALSGEAFRRPDVAPALERPAGAFVSLHRYGELRGCIGTLEADRPMVDAVAEAAVAAATRDRRFNRMTVDELAECDLEISVLGRFVEVCEVDEVVVGRDGLYLRAGVKGGLLLPQVAGERGWDRATFLEHLCSKAGLPPGSWHGPDARLERFTAEVFGEKVE